MSPTTTEAPILKRRARDWTKYPRPVVFSPWRGYAMGTILRRAAETGKRQVYLVGGWDAASTPPHDWWYGALAQGWTIDNYSTDPASARYTWRDGKTRIDVRMSGAWFGECADRDTLTRAHTVLTRLLQLTFDAGAVVMGTPARTGADLLERSLPRMKDPRRTPYEYPTIPAELGEIIRHNIPQGRMEFCPPPPRATRAPQGLYILDARWMYAACVRGLPVGPWTHDEAPDFEPFRNGFYGIRFRVPQGWGHVGILPMWDAGDERTVWPSKPLRAGGWYETWATEPELRIAYDKGWDIAIQERILAAPSNIPGNDPARQWIDTLTLLREMTVPKLNPADLRPLLRDALRHIVIDSVGNWYRSSRSVPHVTPDELRHTIPTETDGDPLGILDERGNITAWEWYSPARLDPDQLPLMRPEWAAMTWGRSRQRIVERALTLDRRDIAAFRTDALVLLRDPGWVDDGKIGTFRLKRQIAGPCAMPRDEATYRELLSQDGGDLEDE